MELVARVFGEDVALVMGTGADPGEAAVRTLVPPVERVRGGVVETQVKRQGQLIARRGADAAEGTLVVLLLMLLRGLLGGGGIGRVTDHIVVVGRATKHRGQFGVLE